MARRLLVDVCNMPVLERRIEECGTALDALMRRAGRATARQALAALSENGVSAPYECEASEAHIARPHVAVLAGSGNNGGDGWVAAETLALAGCKVTLATPVAACDIKAEPARSEACRIYARCKAGDLPLLEVLVAPDDDGFRSILSQVECIVDAMLGIGFSGGALRAPFPSWIDAVEQARRSGCFVVAADVPSGLDAQTGSAADAAVRADVTVTMIACKPGLLEPAARDYVGKLVCADLGVGDEACALAQRLGIARGFASVLDRGFRTRLSEYIESVCEDSCCDDMLSASIAMPVAASAAPVEMCAPAPAPALASVGRRVSAPECVPASAPAAAPVAKFAAGACRPNGLRPLLDALDEPFSTTLLRIIDEKGLTDVEVYRRAHMSRQHFSKIRSASDYRPTKKTALVLAIALELSLEETKDLLERAGFALSHASISDVIVEFFLMNGQYDLFAINEALFAYDQPLL